MKKLAVLCNITLMATLLMFSGCQATGENTSVYAGPTISGELPAGWQKTNNIELEHLIGNHLPTPTYLPSGYEIKETYYIHEPSDSPPSTDILFLISDRQVEWADSQYTCRLALSLDWNNAGLGLKMPWAEYIPEIRGRLEDKEGEYTLWWETYGSPESLGSTFRLHTSNQFSREELVKITASMPSSDPASQTESESELSVTASSSTPSTFQEDFGFRRKQMSLEEASNLIGVTIPMPTYLPEGYAVQEIYLGVGNGTTIVLISDRPIEKVDREPPDEPKDYQIHLVKCKMQMYVSFNRDLRIIGANTKPISLAMDFDDRAEQWVVFWGKGIESKIASLQLIAAKDVVDKDEVVKIAQSVE